MDMNSNSPLSTSPLPHDIEADVRTNRTVYPVHPELFGLWGVS